MNSTDAQINLPDEMWLEVFDYLPLYDRKHIRLTCRRFYEICNCARLLAFEELVFLGNFNTNAAIESLSSSQRKTWNIKLKLVRLMDDSILIFFQNQGANIRSLEFDHCTIKPALLQSILTYCENLRSVALHLRIEDHAPKEWDCAKDNVLLVFGALNKNGITRQYVTDFAFTLISDCETPVTDVLTNKKFNDLFKIFPNVKKLKLHLFGTFHFHESNLKFGQSSNVTLDTEFFPSSICHQIYKIRHQLEQLTITYECEYCEEPNRDCPSLAMFNEIASIEMKNMKSLSLRLTINLWNYSIMYPVLRLEYLTDFQCFIGNTTTSVTDVLQVILTTAPNLYSLDIISTFSFVINKDCFLLLVRSKLRSLELREAYMETDFDHSSLNESLLSNHFLIHLYFREKLGSRYSILLLFATFFHSLNQLDVFGFQVPMISTILKHQTKLQYLNFYTDIDLSEYSSLKSSLQHWLKTEGQLYRKFYNLTYLSVDGSKSLEVSEFLLSELEFPKLRSFVIKPSFSVHGILCMDSFIQTIQKLTELEYIEIEWPFKVSFPQLLSLFKNLSKLRYFFIDDAESTRPWSDLEYRELFQVCPSLRVLDHMICSTASFIQLKDALTNDIIKLNRSEYTRSYFISEKYEYYNPYDE